MTFKKLQVGKTYYTVTRQKMVNTTMKTVAVHQVVVTALNEEDQSVTASWNHNPPRRVRENDWRKWRSERPVMVPSGLGYRLATREEIKARGEGGKDD